MIRRSYIFLCVLLAGSALGAQQRGTAPPTPTFRVQVESIEVGVRVTDAEGRFVANLTEDDFEIREDG